MSEKLFLSYARDDDESFVRRLYEDLRTAGFDVWFDRVSMPSRGLSFLQEIRDEIDRCDRVLLVVGPGALGSEYVRAEWGHALVFAKAVLPVLRLGDYDAVPRELGTHIPDFRASRPYEEALRELLDKLAQPVPPLGPLLTAVPVLPLHFVPRGSELDQLEGLVLGDALQPIVISGAKQATAVVGMGGLGKSVLAAALARSARARRFFAGGVAWVEVGERGGLLDAARMLLAVFGAPDWNASWSQVRAQLPAAIGERACLIVLDDLWQGADVGVIQGSLGKSGRLMITTRDVALAEELGAPVMRLDLMAEEQSLRLLASWAGVEVAALPQLAREVARECGHLPLALALCGALIRDGLPWREVLDALQEADPEVLSKAFRAMEASLNALQQADPARAALYTSLAVFPSDRPLPVAAVATWWRAQGVPSERGVHLALLALQGKALLQIQGKLPGADVSLHDLQFDYLRDRTRDRRLELHRGIVEAYRACGGGDWRRVPDDGYFLAHVGRHLVEAGRADELRALLLDFDWLHRKLAETSVAALLADFDRLPDTHALPDLRRALHQSAPALARDASQLAGQLLGRLGGVEGGASAPLMEQARRWRGAAWLRPVLPSLLPPHSALSLVLAGHEGTVRTLAISPDGRALATAGNSNPDQTVRLWDLDSGIELHCLTGEAQPGLWTPMAFCDERQLVTSFANELRVWEWRVGKLARRLALPSQVAGMAGAPRAERLACVDEAGRVRVWSTETWLVSSEHETRATPCLAIAMSAQGDWVACAAAERVEAIELATGRTLRVDEPTGLSAAWGVQPALHFVDGVQSLLWGRPLRCLDLRTGVSRAVAEAPVMAFQIDSRAGLALGALPASEFDFPSLYDLATFRHRGRLRISINDQPTDRTPSCLALSPGGTLAIMADFQHRIEVWTTSRVEELPEDDVQRALRFRFTDDSRYLWVKPQLGSKRVLLAVEDGSKVDDPALLASVEADIEHHGKIDAGWRRRAERSGFRVLDAGARGALITGEARGKGSEFEEPDVPQRARWPVRFSEFGRERERVLHGHSLQPLAGVLFHDGTRAATAGIGRVIRVWDLADGRALHVLRGHGDTVCGLAVSGDERWLLSCGNDRTAKLWELETGRLVATYSSDRPLHRAAASRDGRWFAVAKGPSGRIHLLRLHLPDDPADAVARAGAGPDGPVAR